MKLFSLVIGTFLLKLGTILYYYVALIIAHNTELPMITSVSLGLVGVILFIAILCMMELTHLREGSPDDIYQSHLGCVIVACLMVATNVLCGVGFF